MATRVPSKKTPSFGKRMFWMLLGALVVFGGIFFVQAMIGRQTNDMFDNMQPPPVAVSTFEARQDKWADDVEAVGTLVAVNGTDVTTEAGGVVRELLFTAGQPVRAGTVLVRLNTSNEAATLRALEASAKLAVTQRDRWRELGGQQLVSKADVDERNSTAANSLAQVEAQRALIAQKTIRAPFDGVLGIRQVNLGQYLNPGDPIVSLQSLDPIYLDFSLPEQMVSKVRQGAKITATVDALPGKSFGGVITAIEPDVDPGTRNFQVQATLDNPDTALRPGSFAKVKFSTGRSRSVVVIPQTAVSFNPYGNAVYVVNEAAPAKGAKTEEGEPAGPRLTVKQRFIQTGTTRGDLVAVTEGLKPGERVVTSGLLKLRNDALVTINNKVSPSAETRPDPENR